MEGKVLGFNFRVLEGLLIKGKVLGFKCEIIEYKNMSIVEEGIFNIEI